MKKYSGLIPPCGIYCGGCPRFNNGNRNSCGGVKDGCLNHKCKTIYHCCVVKKGLNYCYECSNYPCSRFKSFAETWKKLGEDLIENQKQLKEKGEEYFLRSFCE